MKIKDLKIAYNVLCELDHPVPQELLVHLSQRIRAIETRSAQRKMERMTEDQLIHWAEKQKRTLRIYMPDGRLIQKPTSEATFREAIRAIGAEPVASLNLMQGRKPVVRQDVTLQRRRYKHYYFLKPGYFLLDFPTAAERYAVLRTIDERLQLNWEIELI